MAWRGWSKAALNPTKHELAMQVESFLELSAATSPEKTARFCERRRIRPATARKRQP